MASHTPGPLHVRDRRPPPPQSIPPRLFEMGFAGSILDILRRCPENRQTALFSATLPSALAEFTGYPAPPPSVPGLGPIPRLCPPVHSGPHR